MELLAFVLFVIVISIEFYEHRRMKYEVFGIIIDPEKGATGVGNRMFRSEKEALRYYKACQDQYFSAVIQQL